MHDHLILFTRYPRPGQTKTRLIPALGAQGAAEFQKRLTMHCLDQVQRAGTVLAMRLTVFYCSGSREQMRQWLPGLDLCPQHGKNLGERMINAFIRIRNQGGGKILLMGSDCPQIDTEILSQAFHLLADHDTVIGPSHDGGFYLLGISSSLSPERLAPLRGDIAWGSDQVFSQTLEHLNRQQLSLGRLPVLHDIDHPHDLIHFPDHAGSQ